MSKNSKGYQAPRAWSVARALRVALLALCCACGDDLVYVGDGGAGSGMGPCIDAGADAACIVSPGGPPSVDGGTFGGIVDGACADPAVDTDGDGRPDCQDQCPNDPNKTRTGVCGCKMTDTDEDHDGALDCNDACPKDPKKTEEGMCGCGAADKEGDLDADGVVDCLDECPSDPMKSEKGACGCGAEDIDRTGDDKPDCGLSEDALISAGFAHSCAVASDGRAFCWGTGSAGQLGSGNTMASKVPVAVVGLTDVVQISNRGYAAQSTGCAVLAAGGVACWGYGGLGAIGDGKTTATNPMPMMVVGLMDAAQVSVSTGHACAVRATGAVTCWGEGAFGKLGNGSTTNSNMPVAVQGITDGLSVSAGAAHTCAVRGDGQAVCWGNRANGRLGDGGDTTGNQSTPAVVSGLTDVLQVSAGSAHSCAVLATGKVMCWGARGNGRLGDAAATTGDQATPVMVSGISDAVQVSAGRLHSCAVLGDGKVACWGAFSGNRLGDGGTATSDQAAPVMVMGITDAKQVSVGDQHSCAATQASGMLCWGNNANSQLGDGMTVTPKMPVAVAGLP
jgi:alpha-tubulin suppressor-like RCC1 family protein